MSDIQLIYASRKQPDVSEDAISSILETARNKNRESSITGALFFNGDYFLQYLEGPRDQVNDLYSRISQDSRHTDVTILSAGDIYRRLFETWSMAYLPNSVQTRPLAQKYLGTDHLDPFQFTDNTATAFMHDLSLMANTRHQSHVGPISVA